MNREILFRGKRIKPEREIDKYEYGSLVTVRIPLIPRHKPPMILNYEGLWAVDPTTIEVQTDSGKYKSINEVIIS